MYIVYKGKVKLINSQEELLSEMITGSETCTLSDFRQYANSLAFDVISNGKYKSILDQGYTARKPWAVNMHDARDMVLQTKFNIVSLVEDLPIDKYHNVVIAATCVMHNNQPPTTRENGAQNCYITNEIINNAINLTACNFHSKKRISNLLQTRTGKHLTDITASGKICVSENFQYFFTLLWYVSKLDMVIKQYTKMWLAKIAQSHAKTPLPSVASLCKKFLVDNGNVDKLYNLFDAAHSHVTQSICELKDAKMEVVPFKKFI